MKKLCFLFVILLFSTLSLWSQGLSEWSGAIKSSLVNDRDTIDFGYNLAGDSAFVYRFIYFINSGSERLIVRDTNFNMLSIPPRNAKTEFSVLISQFPIVIDTSARPSSPRVDTIRCLSTTFLNDAPEGVNVALLKIVMTKERTGQADSIIASRNFVLRFVKSLRPVWTESVLNFDSVYVGGSVSRLLTLRNTDLKRSVRIDDTSGTVAAGIASHFRFDDNPLRILPRDSGKGTDVGVSYTALSLGLDSVDFTLHHYNPSALRQAEDSTHVQLRGVGVQQKIEVTSALGRRAHVVDSIVDVGRFTVGARDTTSIVFFNRGNIPFNSRLVFHDVSNAASTKFRVLDSLHRGRRHIGVGSWDTLRVEFSSDQVEDVELRAELLSDIANRVQQVPDSVRSVFFRLRGHTKERVLRSISDTINFDTVSFYAPCPTSLTRTLQLHNYSNTRLTIDSFRITQSSTAFTQANALLSIDGNGNRNISVSFSPGQAGQFQGILFIESDSDDVALAVRLVGFGVAPQPGRVRFGSDSYKVFPGHTLVIPIVADGRTMQLARRFGMRMKFDSSILELRDIEVSGTASAGANTVQHTSNAPGDVTVNITMAETFFNRDTVARLIFNTFLGYSDRTDIAVQNISLSNDSCSQIVPLENPSTIVYLDSLCGLQYKLPRTPILDFVLSAPVPNPVHDESRCAIVVAFATRVKLSVLNNTGREVMTILDAELSPGLHVVNIPSGGLAEGSYYVRMNAGIYNAVEQFVVVR